MQHRWLLTHTFFSQILHTYNGSGNSRHTSLRFTVECVCEDSANFEDADGDGCSAYSQGSSKHSRCADVLHPTDTAARVGLPAGLWCVRAGPVCEFAVHEWWDLHTAGRQCNVHAI